MCTRQKCIISIILNAESDCIRAWGNNALSACTVWPRKNATLTINNVKKTRDRMKKLCALLRHIKLSSFSSKLTSRSLILIKACWFYGRFSEAMSFSRFDLLSQKSQFTYQRFSIVWLPRVKCLLLLYKAKSAWIKRSIHYITLPHYNPGELLKEMPPYFEYDFWYKRSIFWKWHSFRKMVLESKRLHQNYKSWCHFAEEKKYSTH